MPKILHARLEVPSGSRVEPMHKWLNKQLEPHKMKVTCVQTEDGAESFAEIGSPLLPAAGPDYKVAWEEMHKKLSWMQGHPGLNKYLGFNFADIANALIDEAYPGLREQSKAKLEANK